MISTRGRYAIRVMLDIAEQKSPLYIPLKDIADRQEISKKYLEIIVKDLVGAGFLVGRSGKGGGYRLTKDPKDYTVGEILEYMEGSLSSVACLAKDKNTCPRASICETLPMWSEYDKLTRDFFYGRTLEDLLEQSKTEQSKVK